MGHTYAGQTYPGVTANRGFNTFFTWLELLEGDRNESPNHIPEGLYHDLIDNTNINEPAGVTDNVSGFTNENCFSCMTSDIRSIEEFRQCLVENHLTGSGNTLADLIILFNSY